MYLEEYLNVYIVTKAFVVGKPKNKVRVEKGALIKRAPNRYLVYVINANEKVTMLYSTLKYQYECYYITKRDVNFSNLELTRI